MYDEYEIDDDDTIDKIVRQLAECFVCIHISPEQIQTMKIEHIIDIISKQIMLTLESIKIDKIQENFTYDSIEQLLKKIANYYVWYNYNTKHKQQTEIKQLEDMVVAELKKTLSNINNKGFKKEKEEIRKKQSFLFNEVMNIWE